MLEVVIPLFLCAAARRPAQISNSGIGPLRVPFQCFTCPGLHPIGLPWSVDHPHLTVPGNRRLVSDGTSMWWCREPVPVCVCGMTPNQTGGGDFPAATSRRERERERSSCTAKEHSNLQYNGMQWDLIDHRCFIIYPFTIIGRDFRPSASV